MLTANLSLKCLELGGVSRQKRMSTKRVHKKIKIFLNQYAQWRTWDPRSCHRLVLQIMRNILIIPEYITKQRVLAIRINLWLRAPKSEVMLPLNVSKTHISFTSRFALCNLHTAAANVISQVLWIQNVLSVQSRNFSKECNFSFVRTRQF